MGVRRPTARRAAIEGTRDEPPKAFRSGRAERTNAAVLPRLAPDAPWPAGQPVFGLVVRSGAAAEVPGRPGSSWSQIRPQALEPRGDRHRGGQALPRIDARPRV